MINKSDYEVNESIDLAKVIGCNVKNVLGYISMEYGEPTFVMTKVVMENGGVFWAEGEHDMPYLTNGYGDNSGKFDEDLLRAIYKAENGEEHDEAEYD